MATLLNKDTTMIERMELDLRAKAAAAFEAYPDLSVKIHGIFSLDVLETLSEQDIAQNSIAVGVQYSGCEKHVIDKDPRGMASPSGNGGGRIVVYSFLVVLAVPSAPQCEERYDATQLLSILRLNIQNKAIADDPVARAWDFEREAPNITASTATMLFYSQVWRVALPNVGL